MRNPGNEAGMCYFRTNSFPGPFPWQGKGPGSKVDFRTVTYDHTGVTFKVHDCNFCLSVLNTMMPWGTRYILG